jgi:hypothetical protein
MPKSSPRDWLDPHCHESEFDRKPTRWLANDAAFT